jgi:hypothetical protein
MRGKSRRSLELIEACVSILQEIQPASVRAVAYQLFNRKLIPSMKTGDVARVSRLLVIAREEGTIPWEWIVDPTREVEIVPTWTDPAAFARAVQDSYRRNKWQAQPVHAQVWSEKSTVAGTLGPVLQQYEVPFQVVHGWSGATPIRGAATGNLRRTQDTVILYVGDFDPSGMFMSESDLPRRLARYSTTDPSRDMELDEALDILDELRLSIRRVALTAADTRTLGHDVAFSAEDKRLDPRYREFVSRYGWLCWELDAMSPAALRDRVEAEIVALIEPTSWARYVDAEEAERESIEATCRTWTSILEQDGNCE